MSEGRTWIGVDLGTQSVRALAVADDGEVLATASRPLHSHRWTDEHGAARHEQDPATWWSAARDALAEVCSRIRPDAVGGVAVDGTSGTVVLLGRDGSTGPGVTGPGVTGPGVTGPGVTGPGVMYDDARGRAHAARVQEAGAALWDRLGYRIGPSWALPTLLTMLAEHDGDRADLRVVHQVDVVTEALVGHPVATDSSSALKTGYDLLERRWPADVLDALGLDPALLPEVVAPGRVLGGVGAGAAEATGLRAGTPVVAGMTDGCAAQLGAGAVTPGAWNSVLGTTLIIKGVTRELLHDPAGTVYSHRGPDGSWLPGGASSTGAGVLGELIAPDRFDAVTGRLDRGAPERVPVAYPLAGQGERFPFAAPEARGFFLDRAHGGPRPLGELVTATDEVTAFAAVCEGVAFVERLCFDHLATLGADTTGTRTITGGATANGWWNRLRATVLQTPLHRPASAEPALGMAVLAAAGVGAADTGNDPDVVDAAGRMVRIVEVVDPDPDPGGADGAGALAERYRELVEALADRGWIGDDLAARAAR